MTTINVNPVVSGAVCGRLTLTSGTPVLTSTVSSATTVYFTPYKGNLIPITLDGVNFFFTTFSEMSQATTDATLSPAAVGTSKVYDVFVWSNSGTLEATRGPAWSTSTSRGTGAGTSQLTLVNGYYVNAVAITNGPGVNLGLYVGTIGSNGSSTIDFILGGSASGGTAGVLNVWNNYNRVMAHATTIDNGATYTYTSSTPRQPRASSGNQVSFVSGLAEDAVQACYNQSFNLNTAIGANASVGISLDSTSAFTSPQSQVDGTQFTTSFTLTVNASIVSTIAPQLGSHFISPIELSDNSHANVFNNNSYNNFTVNLPM